MSTRDVKPSFTNNSIKKSTLWIFTLYVTILTSFQENDLHIKNAVDRSTDFKLGKAGHRESSRPGAGETGRRGNQLVPALVGLSRGQWGWKPSRFQITAGICLDWVDPESRGPPSWPFNPTDGLSQPVTEFSVPMCIISISYHLVMWHYHLGGLQRL